MTSIGFVVAEMPTRVGGCSQSASSRSSDSARCAPRLLPASAWISSTMTVLTVRSMFRPDSVREQDVQRLRRRDQDVRRLAAHARALALRRVARAHGRANRRFAEHACRELAADAFERRAQVLLDVVRERLQRRDVEDLRFVAQRAVGGLLREQDR